MGGLDRRKAAEREAKGRFASGFSQPDRAAREQLAKGFITHMSRIRESVGAEVWGRFDAAVAHAVETADAAPLMAMMDVIDATGATSQHEEPAAPLVVDVRWDDAPSDRSVVLLFRGPRDETETAATAPLLGGRARLVMPEGPTTETWHRLPPRWGGPLNFSLGYVGVLRTGRDLELEAYDPKLRVVWLRAPFPVAQYRAALQANPPADMPIDKIDEWLGWLGKFPVGLSLVTVEASTGSLLGFRKAPEGTEATLVAGPWPPQQL